MLRQSILGKDNEPRAIQTQELLIMSFSGNAVNRQLVGVRLTQLKKKFTKDETYKEDYMKGF